MLLSSLAPLRTFSFVLCLAFSAKTLFLLSLCRMDLFFHHFYFIISFPPGSSHHYGSTIFLWLKGIKLGCINKWSSNFFLHYFPTIFQMVLRNRHLCFPVEKARPFCNSQSWKRVRSGKGQNKATGDPRQTGDPGRLSISRAGPGPKDWRGVRSLA